MKKIGIITFHRSYNCGSMLQTYALQNVVNKFGYNAEVIDFSNDGQKKLYGVFFPFVSLKNIVKNVIIFPFRNKISNNNKCYESFLKKNVKLSPNSYSRVQELNQLDYSIVIAGSDQIWNITIEDSDDAYFLGWLKNTKKVAYAPSFGAHNILENSNNPEKYINWLSDFDNLSIRENNGKRWIKELVGKDVPVVLDPTLLLDAVDYENLLSGNLLLPKKYVFYYSPHYESNINRLVDSISKKYDLPVIGFNSKAFYVKRMHSYGFTLPEYESPSVYLELIKNAELVITTSFHGTIFSAIFRKKFWVVKNGGMFGSDDRVTTMTDMLDLSDRIIPIKFNNSFDYLKEKDYISFEGLLENHRNESFGFLENALKGNCD